MTDQLVSSRLRTLFELALEDYEIKTKISLATHPLAQKLENCHSVDSITALLQDQARTFGESRGKDRITKSIRSTVSFLYKLSATAALGDDLGLAFPPAKVLQTGLGVLLTVANGVTASYDAIVDLLESIEHFLMRLYIYTKIPPTPAMDEILVKIVVELISTLALATAELRQGRTKKFVKQLQVFGGGNDAEVILQRVDRLTLDEARTTGAEVLQVVYGLVQGMNGKASGDAVRQALENIHEIVRSTDKSKRDILLQVIRNWLSPPDPWKNHNFACHSRHEGSATWFVQGDTFSEWKSSGPSSLLWIHGKPGSGKSVLCSTIIENIDAMRKCGLASLAFFYHDFREDDKRYLRGLLSSILFQFCDQSDSYYNVLSEFYSTHRFGAQQPSDDALGRCLEDILKLPGQAPIFLIVDALDECPNTSPTPSHREEALVLVEKLIDLQLPNLRICVTSRPESDIKVVLEILTFRSISLHDERGQIEDIENYIKSVVEKDPRNRRWTAQDKQMVIDVLTRNADGMFRWVYCQVLHLRGCHPGRIRHALAELPETLDETYGRTLREINMADWEFAHRLFQSAAAASRPLRVEELAEFLAFDFDAGPIPRFNEGWRLEDPIMAVQSICPSFLCVVDIGGSQIIQFSHFSVKEFLTSSRLAEEKQDISRYHVSMTPAHTVVAKACLGILLHLDKSVAKEALQKFPLASYAALHWADHARFEGVSRNVEDGVNTLFDSSKPHLAIWVSLHNMELPSWKLFKQGERPLPPSGTPLHYASICGLHAFVKSLVVEHPHDVDSRGFDNLTPLHMASLRGYEQVARVLLEGGADVAAQNDADLTPLHVASREGHLQVVRALLEHGASTTARDKVGSTPLHLALQPQNVKDPRVPRSGADARAEDGGENSLAQLHGAVHIDFISYLVSQKATVQVTRHYLEREMHTTAQGSTLSYVALRNRHTGTLHVHPKPEADAMVGYKSEWNHLASRNGHVEVAQLLVKHGADPTARNEFGSCPLHFASLSGDIEVVQFLIEHGADPTVQDNDGWTPLHSAALGGHSTVVQFLVGHGADPTAQNKDGWTPLHSASKNGHVEVVQFLVEHGADPTAQDKDGRTPLHFASQTGHVKAVQFLVEHGADPIAQDKDGWTPLHVASKNGHVEIVQFLVEDGADLTAQDRDGWSPLHVASRNGHVEIVQFFVEHGADAAVQSEDGTTPLHRASEGGHVDVASLLIEHGADAAAQDKDGSTLLHRASQSLHIDFAQFLVEHGANVTAQDKDGSTPLHLAALHGHEDLSRMLIEHGGDVGVRDKDWSTPLHLASRWGHVDLARVLVEHGADVAAQDDDGSTPLHWASRSGHVDLALLLITHGADAAAQDKNGLTPLLAAAESGPLDFPLARVLLTHGADAVAQDKEGSPRLHWGEAEFESGHANLMRRLLEPGGDATARDNDKSIPLRGVSESGVYVDLAQLRVAPSASMAAQDKDRWTPPHGASERGYVDLMPFHVEDAAGTTVKDMEGPTPLNLDLVESESGRGKPEQSFNEHGADVAAQDLHGWTQLHEAAQAGDVSLARSLVEHGADTNAQDKDGLTPLHWVFQSGHVDLAQLLIEHGADVVAQDNDGSTPLHWTSESRHVEFAQLLIERGAKVTAEDKHGSTPLHWASRTGRIDLARFLVEQGALVTAQDNDGFTPQQLASQNGHVMLTRFLERVVVTTQDNDGSTPLHQASQDGNLERILVLLGEGATADSRDENGVTPLHLASRFGHLEIVRALLTHGAYANPRDESGCTPLHFASKEGCLDIVRLLLDHGGNSVGLPVDLNVENEDQQTPLFLASRNGRPEVVQFLLERGADFERHDWLKRTPLHVASKIGHHDATRLLLGQGANVNAKDELLWTPLHMASKDGKHLVIQLLLGRGADAGAQDDLCQTPLHMASQEGHLEVVLLLLRYTADVHTPDVDGETALHLAAYYGHLKVTELLLKHNANIHNRNKKGETPFDLASKGGHQEVAKLLAVGVWDIRDAVLAIRGLVCCGNPGRPDL